MTKQKEIKLEKVVEWGEYRWEDSDFLFAGLLFMIPILGQILWLMCLFEAYKSRKVYWRQIK